MNDQPKEGFLALLFKKKKSLFDPLVWWHLHIKGYIFFLLLCRKNIYKPIIYPPPLVLPCCTMLAIALSFVWASPSFRCSFLNKNPEACYTYRDPTLHTNFNSIHACIFIFSKLCFSCCLKATTTQIKGGWYCNLLTFELDRKFLPQPKN